MGSKMFSVDGYRQLLSAIDRYRYRAITIPEIERGGSHQIVMRHDVDCCMDYARDMARLEASAGVRATYFVMLRSPMYNLFSRHNSAMLRAIVDLGHDIGLHYDAKWTEIQEGIHEEQVRFEAETLEKLSGSRVKSFSIHQPNSKMISQGLTVGSIINLYDEQHFGGFAYVSDSNRDWRGKDILELFASHKNVQLLTHPMWWICEAPTTAECWDRTIRLNFQSAQQQILETERAYGPARELAVHRQDGGKTNGAG